ncbi:MAG: sigma-54-dependent Fis family transcriptional regulator [Bryobacteraceae bacterium]|nr:sigma-54-dependent Fis family transcriptional regulator [Bryobacteraceae bacterium]
MATRRVLVVDDEENIGRSLRLILEREGYAVAVCHSAAEFRNFIGRVDIYLLDVRLPDGSGLDLLRVIKTNDNTAPVVMISGHGTIADAVEATRAGAWDFLEKPLSREKVLLALKNALEQSTLRVENERLRELVGSSSKMIGSSPVWIRVVEQASLAARSDGRVLLNGESGTGKELLAAHIHENSPFSSGPFVKVNCAAIPTELIEAELFGHEKGAYTGAVSARRGKFELADGGTIFLDEVGDLHSASQAKLLRILQEGEFHRVGGEQPVHINVRVLSATNRDLTEMIRDGKFREDLYYRLCVVPIRVPGLRERPQDIPALSSWFLTEFCSRNNFRPKLFEDGVIEVLQSYTWPGNVRELRNVVERMAILTPEELIPVEAIPVEIRRFRDNPVKSSVQEARESAERDHILRALDAAEWNVSSAARALGLERTNLHKRMRALGVTRER